MDKKTKVHAEDGSQVVLVTREFDLPVDLLFKAHTDPSIVEQWMGTKVLKLDCHPHGGYRFETIDPHGNKHGFSGVFHDVVPGQKITRTFEMENTNFPVQLEFIEFEDLDDTTSRLTIRIVYKSVEDRDRMLQLPFAQGINMAHNRIQEILSKSN